MAKSCQSRGEAQETQEARRMALALAWNYYGRMRLEFRLTCKPISPKLVLLGISPHPASPLLKGLLMNVCVPFLFLCHDVKLLCHCFLLDPPSSHRHWRGSPVIIWNFSRRDALSSIFHDAGNGMKSRPDSTPLFLNNLN